MKYEVLIFDADDTLFDFSYAERLAIKQIIISQIPKKEFEKYFQIYKEVNKQVWNEREQKLISFDELKSERFRRFFRITNINLNAIQSGKDYLIHLSKVTKLLPFAYQVVSKLSREYKLVILTNGLTSVQKPRFMKSSIQKFIDLLVISEEVGFSKPEPEIFNIVCEKLNYFDKSKMLMIGDNYSSDIAGGINFGIDTCWLNLVESETIRMKDLKFPTYKINSIREILNLLFR